jgi:hypothetical protein
MRTELVLDENGDPIGVRRVRLPAPVPLQPKVEQLEARVAELELLLEAATEPPPA